jgi:hypothetical protein
MLELALKGLIRDGLEGLARMSPGAGRPTTCPRPEWPGPKHILPHFLPYYSYYRPVIYASRGRRDFTLRKIGVFRIIKNKAFSKTLSQVN